VHFLAAQQGNIGAGIHETQQITRKLDQVAETLLVPYEDCLTGQILALPYRQIRDEGFGRCIRTVPAAFEIFEPGFQAAREEERTGPVVSRIRIVRLMFQRLVKIEQSLVDPACLLKSDAKTGQGLRIMRLDAKGFVITGHGFRTTIELLQNIAAIKPHVMGGGIEAEGFVEAGQSLTQTTEFVKRRAANAKTLRMVGGASQDLVAGLICLVGTTQLKQSIGAICQGRQKSRPNF
jgi:hypothetical protein